LNWDSTDLVSPTVQSGRTSFTTRSFREEARAASETIALSGRSANRRRKIVANRQAFVAKKKHVSDSITLEWLSTAIAQATKSAKFCVWGSFPIVDPGLDMEGLGPIRLPLKPRMAKPLIASCHTAPYGKGTQTLVDRDVRKQL
jgi:hypothetical protein